VPQASLRIRVDRLDHRVDDIVKTLDGVARLELQFLQFREEMRMAFSALDATVRAGDEETRHVLREEIRAGDEETRRVLRGESRDGDGESRRFMRVLYEDLVDRIKTLGEGGPLTP
jgi:hypothetical protein